MEGRLADSDYRSIDNLFCCLHTGVKPAIHDDGVCAILFRFYHGFYQTAVIVYGPYSGIDYQVGFGKTYGRESGYNLGITASYPAI